MILIAIAWCLLTLAAAMLVGQQVRDWSLQQLQTEGQDRLLATINRIRSALDEYRYLPFLLTQNDDVRRLLLADNPEHWTEVSRYLEQTNLVAGAAGLFILDRKGRALAYSHWREAEGFFAGSHAEQPYFLQAAGGEQGRHFALQHGVAPAYFLSAPVYNQHIFIGAAVVRVNLLNLLPELPDAELFTVSDDNGQVFLTPRSGWQLQRLDSLYQKQNRLELADGTSVQLWLLADKRRLMAQSVRLDDLGWTFTSLTPIREAEQRGQAFMLATLGGGLALGLLLLYVRERHLKHLSQQETRDALARSEAQQRTIISQSEVGLITIDQQGGILFINPMAMQQFGVSQPLVNGMKLENLLAGLDQFGPIRRALSRLAQPGFVPVTGYEVVGRRGDGTEFPMLFSIRRMRNEPEPQYLVTVIDITRRKRLEHALRDANESLEQKVIERTRALEAAQQELVQAGKLAALGRMSSAVVHELNQPLTAMRTYLAICRQLLDQPQLLAENLKLLDGLTNRMEVITRQLKTFAYKKPEALGPVSLATVIDQSLLLFRDRFASGGIELNCRPEQAAVSVSGDSARLEQVLINLVKNACDAIDQQGGRGEVLIAVERMNGQVLLQVADSGPGIAEEHLEQLFEPFFTTKSIGSGLGLGLAIVASIVRDLGGEISVSNRPEGGACFRVTLQAADNEP
ncbi:sensor histidine kinase [Marinobacterium arenosum]|uniref:sensor histidine kinase n=1 Tax=Marinobacterium arenosum TaxID=2862496 RepID=UPI001C981451|nr:ATP-binding protein [Marinobacterium arenosum]MBY4678773.1 PAS domain S-box protein [Marinobacterium arenosum]